MNAVTAKTAARLRLAVRGAVQGVGFRPFVHRLATELRLNGWVSNTAQGALIEVEGSPSALEEFRRHLNTDKPASCCIENCETTVLNSAGGDGFVIRESDTRGSKSALVLPDLATCPDCLREIFDPADRRRGYPFTNCTNCGPRFSIVEALPYDRANTSMRGFKMCPACQAEYLDPANRRFHAQPNACPACGPRLELWNESGEPIFGGHEALLAASQAIRRGRIVAVKGIGGFHLFADAQNDATIRRLRERKHREEKPFALIFPHADAVKQSCEVSSIEEKLLHSPAAPIVLLRRLKSQISNFRSQISDLKSQISDLRSQISPLVAPGSPNLGVMLPSNPLHHLLMAELGFPVVATSGNLSDEPICTDAFEALERLRGIADLFLVHNRPIIRHMDDSIVRVMQGREMILRRARGYAPLPVAVRIADCRLRNVLAVGAHLKNAVALSVDDQVFISQHIGDLETEQAHLAFRRSVADLPALYEAKPAIVAADLHPDYLSTRFANEAGQPAARVDHADPDSAPDVIGVQHHVAHAFSCLAENEAELPALGVAWDGTGLGTDGTIWGGEFFLIADEAVERVAHFRPFRLPGGDAAAREPRRSAIGLLFELFGDSLFARGDVKSLQTFTPAERATLRGMLGRGTNAPWCCSVGRLFDAVASITGLRHHTRFEGQAAIELESAAESVRTEEAYELRISDCGFRNPTGTAKSLLLDWGGMIPQIVEDVSSGVPIGEISARFHNALVSSVLMVARRAGCERVALSGGCFQNRRLLERTVTKLRAEGFQPCWHRRVPTNDGGIALGQIFAAHRAAAKGIAAITPVSPRSPIAQPPR